jgi:hypothetical protein
MKSNLMDNVCLARLFLENVFFRLISQPCDIMIPRIPVELVGLAKEANRMTAKSETRTWIYGRLPANRIAPSPSAFVCCPVSFASPSAMSAMGALYQWAYAKALLETQVARQPQWLGDPNLN